VKHWHFYDIVEGLDIHEHIFNIVCIKFGHAVRNCSTIDVCRIKVNIEGGKKVFPVGVIRSSGVKAEGTFLGGHSSSGQFC